VGGTNFISMNHSYSEGSTTASVLGDCQIDQVGSVYVTLDGNRVISTESTNTFYYQLYLIAITFIALLFSLYLNKKEYTF
jgi:hypothetical protein